MKRIELLLTASLTVCAVAQAQNSASQITASAKGRHGTAAASSTTAAKGANHHNKTVKHVVPPPPTMRAHGAARKSTAETMASKKNHPPLQSLPAFNVTALTGQSVAVSTLEHPGHWLMLYVRPQCVPCESVLQSLAASERTALKGGSPLLVVVRAHSTNDVTELRSKYPSLGDAVWVMDQKGDGIKALKLGSLPTMYGLYDGGVAFTLPGTGGSPAMVEKMAGTWMTRTDHMKPPTSTGTAANAMNTTSSTTPQDAAKK